MLCGTNSRVAGLSAIAYVSHVGANGVRQNGTDRAGMPTYTDRSVSDVADVDVCVVVVIVVVLVVVDVAVDVQCVRSLRSLI